MKKSAFLKLTLALPALALSLASCSNENEPFINSQMVAKVIQKEIPVEGGSPSMVFVPNIIGQAVSNGHIINPRITKDNVTASSLRNFTAYTGHAETYIDDAANYTSTLPALNGVYFFSAASESGNTLTIQTAWNFEAGMGQEFSQSWGDVPGSTSESRIEVFTYGSAAKTDGSMPNSPGEIELKFRPFPEEAANINYYMVIMNNAQTGQDQYRLEREWWGALPGDTDWIPITMTMVYDDPLNPTVGREVGYLIVPGYNDSRFDGKKVFLAAEKVHGSHGEMIVTLLSTPKTINIERGAFSEDPEPTEQDPV